MDSIQSITKKLRKNGKRITKIKKALIAIFVKQEGPISVPEILKKLQKQNLQPAKSTIYREVESLEKAKIITQVYLANEKVSYELASREHHHHLVCDNCEDIIELEVEKIEDAIAKFQKNLSLTFNFTNITHSLEFFGKCNKCSS